MDKNVIMLFILFFFLIKTPIIWVNHPVYKTNNASIVFRASMSSFHWWITSDLTSPGFKGHLLPVVSCVLSVRESGCFLDVGSSIITLAEGVWLMA